MLRHPFNVNKPRINYEKTWATVARLLRNPAPIRPAPVPEHLAEQLDPEKKLKTVKVPQLKGNVTLTLEHIVHIFLAEWRKAPSAINLAIRTTRAALAKRCRNRDPKTAYRHILALIQHGFLRAKVQVKGGLQLLLNPNLLVFDASAAPARPSDSVGAISPELMYQTALAIATKFGSEFSLKRPAAHLKNSMRA